MKVVDLTMSISQSMKVFPGSPQPSFIPWSKFSTSGYDSEAIFMSTHTGTHVDAPSHFAPGLPSIEKLPPSRFVCNAVLLRVPKKPNELVEVEELEDEEINKNDTVVLATGWEKRVASKEYMMHNPGLSADAAQYLVRRKVNAVAIDGPSIDAGKDSGFTAHRILLSKNVLVFENLCNVGRIARQRFTLVVAPLKLRGATGSPARAIALL
jgi:kynurenine formamidase